LSICIPQALDEAIATATQHGINLVIANDPDADRLAVAENIPKIDENGKIDVHQAILNTYTLFSPYSYLLSSSPISSFGILIVQSRSI
jgi:phosphomannomutase